MGPTTRSSSDEYTLVSSAHHDTVFKDFEDAASSKYTDLDAQLMSSIRAHHPGMTVTVIPVSYADLAGYAAAGYAEAELDTSEDALLRWRFYQPASQRGGQGRLGEAFFFARYKYTWNGIKFVVYTVREGYTTLQYILLPPDDDENVLSHSKITDALLQAIGDVQFTVEKSILVYDGYRTRSKALWDEVQRASWDDVILDEKMKKALAKTVVQFFDSEKSYKDLGVPWKVRLPPNPSC
jgi:transitional endoplasmic reticulum ATPase